MTNVASWSHWRRALLSTSIAGPFVWGGCFLFDESTSPSGPANRECGGSLSIVTGDAQIGEVGRAFPNPLVVRAVITPGTAQCSSRPEPGASIQWVASGGGSASPMAPATDAQGEARAAWTAGPTLGAQTVSASWVSSTGAVVGTVTFTSTVYSSPYRALRKLAGDAQSGPEGAVLGVRPEVILYAVQEAGAQQAKRETPLSQAQLQWTVVGGGGVLADLITVTPATGRATANWTLGPTSGPQSLRVAVVASPGAPDPRDTVEVVFSATATAVPVASVELSRPDAFTIKVGQTAQITARTYKADPRAELHGRAVTWQSSNAAVAGVASPNGISPSTITLTGDAVGAADITATSEGKTATVRVTVEPAPAPRQRIAYGVANQPQTPSYAAAFAFNSLGGAVTVTRQPGIGAYRVTLAGQQPLVDETEILLVSAYGEGNHYCKLAGDWGTGMGPELVADVRCFNGSGAAVDAAFSFTLLGNGVLDGRFGFALANQPAVQGPYTPTKSFNAGGPGAQPVSVIRAATGQYVVSFPGNTGIDPQAFHVAAVGSDDARCSISTVGAAGVRVHCFTPSSGAAIDAPFAVTVLDRGRTGARAGFAWTADAAGDEFEIPGSYTLMSSRAFNSALSPVEVVKLGAVGRYEVTFRGFAPPGSTDVLAVQVVDRDEDQPMYCNVVGWSIAGTDLKVAIQCWHADGGDPEDEGFYLIVLQ
jgi:hypothetical protein